MDKQTQGTVADAVGDARIERALQKADCILANLLSAYEQNDMAFVERTLRSMSMRRAQLMAERASLH